MFCCFAVLPSYAQYEQSSAYAASALRKFKLVNIETGQKRSIDISEDNRQLLLFVFLSPECPLSQQYSLSLNELDKLYHQRVAVIGIFPGKSYNRKTITTFLNKYSISFATFIDESKKLSNFLKASVTPEVILLANEKEKLTVQYRGAIDDRVKELRVKRLKASTFYVKDAIEQTLQKKDVLIKRTDPVGCLINDY
jgi:hypothetical protein